MLSGDVEASWRSKRPLYAASGEAADDVCAGTS